MLLGGRIAVRTDRNHSRAMRIAGLTFVQVTKIASLSFIVGACMELFMIKTGFYNIVTRYGDAWLRSTHIQCISNLKSYIAYIYL